MKNRAYHDGIKCSPYEAMFGQPMKCGLKTSNLPDDVIEDISTEEELEALILSAQPTNHDDDYQEDTASTAAGTQVVSDVPADTPDFSIETAALDVSANSTGAPAAFEQTSSTNPGMTTPNTPDSTSWTDAEEVQTASIPSLEEETSLQQPTSLLALEETPTSSSQPQSSPVLVEALSLLDDKEAETQAEPDQTARSPELIESSESMGQPANNQLPCDEAAEAQMRKGKIIAKRKFAKKNLQKQASKMLRLTNNKFTPASVGDSVRVPIPEVDRSKCASRNVIGVVMDIDKEKSMYKIGTAQGVLKTLFTRGEFDVCKESFLQSEDVPEHSTSVREAHGKTAITGSQGYNRCNCTTGCNNNRCKCFKVGNQCNSKCHGSLSCMNK